MIFNPKQNIEDLDVDIALGSNNSDCNIETWVLTNTNNFEDGGTFDGLTFFLA